jgi:hypothetical protein
VLAVRGIGQGLREHRFVGNEHVEDDAPIERMGVRFSLSTVLRKGVDNFLIAAPARVLGAQEAPIVRLVTAARVTGSERG